jgi:hypothetical protein
MAASNAVAVSSVHRFAVAVTLGQVVVEFHEWLPGDSPLARRTVAIDTETTLIDKTAPTITPTLVLVQAFDGERGVFVHPRNLAQFIDAHPDTYWACHNASFDLRVLSKTLERCQTPRDVYEWVEERRVIDTRILVRLLALATTGDTAEGRSSLARATLDHLGLELPKDAVDEDGEEIRTGFASHLNKEVSEIPADALRYAAKDVLATYSLLEVVAEKIDGVLGDAHKSFGFVDPTHLADCIQEYGPLTHDTQLRGDVCCDQMHLNGICIDKDRRAEKLCDLDLILGDDGSVLAAAGIPVNGEVGQSKAVQRYVERLHKQHPHLELPRTPSGKFSTKAEDLATAASHDSNGVLATLVRYKAAEKLRNTYLAKMTGRLHPRFGILKRTGRTNCTGDLAMQTIPKERGAGKNTVTLRQCVVASPGHVFVMADFSQIELVVLGFISAHQFQYGHRLGDCINAGHDVHRIIAGKVIGKAPELVTDDERQSAKAVSFGAPGGMQARTLQAIARTDYGKAMSLEDVEARLGAYFEEFPEVAEHLRKQPARGDVDLCLELARFLRLTSRGFDAAVGRRHFDRSESDVPNAALGGMLLKVLGDPSPCRGSGVPYTQAELDWLWSAAQRLSDELSGNNVQRRRYQKALRERAASKELRGAVAKRFDRTTVMSATGRLRANARFTAVRNTVFQSVAADGGLLAMWRLFRAGYRIVAFVHDEIVVEIARDSDYAAHCAEIARLMIEGMHEVIPGMLVKVEAVVSPSFSKADKLFEARHGSA